MDPMTMIVSALVSGAAAAAKDTASQALKDIYGGLKSLVQHRFQGNKAAEAALEQAEKNPKVWGPPLAQEVADHGIDKDETALGMAERLLEMVKNEVPSASYTVNIGYAQGTVIGPNAQVTQYFGEKPHDEKRQ